jgi:transcriptional regulator with GAF, ATPase, and Fis domain
VKQRSRAAGRPAKPRRGTTAKPKRRAPPSKATRRTSSAARDGGEVARLTRDLNEAREQQTATSEVLRIISGKPGELEPAFDAILANATRICEAKFGNLWLREGDSFRIAATHGAPPKYREFFDRDTVIFPEPQSGLGMILRTKRLVHVADIKSTFQGKLRNITLQLANARSLVAVPLIKDNEVVGAIVIYRQEVRPFTDKQIELVQNFAAQAVIAIENARLLSELRQRTTDLTEALERQTATSEVLQVISRSPGELQPVFQAMLANVVQICKAKFGNLLLFEDGAFRTVALHGAPQLYLEERQREPIMRPKPGSDLDQLVKTKQIVHVPDMRAEGIASSSAIVELAGARTMLSVPML